MFSPAKFVFNLHALPPLITALSVLLLGLIVVIREKGSRVSLLYLGYTLAVSAWLFSASIALLMPTEDTAYAWMKFANAGVTILPIALYHFTAVVLEKEKRHRRRILSGWIVSAIFLAASLLTDVLFGGFYHYSWGIFLRFRPPALLFVLYFFVMTLGTLRLYWLEYRTSDRNTTKHRRAKAFLVAFGIGYLGMLDFLPAFGVPYYPLSSVPIICMLILVSRAIWRYRLVDITPAFAAKEIIDTMNDSLIVLDRDGVIRVANQAACVLLGCGEQELIGRRPADGATRCREFAGTLGAVTESGTVRNLEVTCRSPQAAHRTFRVSTSIMRNPGGERIATVCLVNDITDHRRAEEERELLIAQLQEANEKLKSIDLMKTNFISMASHELRTPLTTIKAFVDLLQMRRTMPDEQKTKLMSTISVETDRLARLITDLLDLSRIEAGSMKWQMSEVSIEELIRSVIASMGILFENKGLRVSTQFGSPLSRVSGDRDRLVQVVTNILSNAVKFTARGGEIHVAALQETEPQPRIVVAISDTGIGIPAAHIPLIFEKFHRSDDELTAAIEGTGLGLAITRQIVEYHGGRIWAASTRGRGSVFTFTLPIRRNENPQSNTQPPFSDGEETAEANPASAF
jgi:PAS domain S-box-containing protein